MKKFFYMAVAAIAALSSCSQDELFENNASEPQNGGFTATIENPSTTRTTLGTKDNEDKYPVLWEAGDEVSINGVTYTAQTGGSATTTLTTTGTDVESTEYKAYYPASLATDFGAPAVQTYKDGYNHNLPMFATSENKNLKFNNLCAVFAITVKPVVGTTDADSFTKVQSITLSSDQAMSGSMNANYCLNDPTDATNTTTLYCEETVTLDNNGTTFYMAVPQGNYTNLNISVSDGTTNYIMSTIKDQQISVVRNTYYPIEFKSETKVSDCLRLTNVDPTGAAGKVTLECRMETKPDIWYSVDSENAWQQLEYGTEITVNHFVLFKNHGSIDALCDANTGNYTYFDIDGEFEASGNIMTLLNGNNPATTFTNKNAYAFMNLFINCTSLVSAKNLKLPATILAEACYASMFQGCKNLTAAPDLPATALAKVCYGGMFVDCTSLETAPVLPVTKLVEWCYYNMFNGCTDLKTAPALPATELADYCYMSMFEGCSSLEIAPLLPAITLAENCYYAMFAECSKLSSVTMLATDVSASECLGDWLYIAGKDATTRTLTVAKGMETTMESYKGYPYYYTVVAAE